MSKLDALQISLLCQEYRGHATLPKDAIEALGSEVTNTPYGMLAVDTRGEMAESGMLGHRIYMYNMAARQWEVSRKIIPTRILASDQFPLTSMLTCMSDGRVMICSNRKEEAGIAPRVLMFDPLSPDNSDAAFEILVDPKKTAHRDQGSLVTLHSGDVLRVGGESIRGSKSNCALFNHRTKKWAIVGGHDMMRESFCVVLQNGQVLITGGSDGRHIVSGCSLYSVQTNTFRATTGMRHERRMHEGCLMSNGNVFVCGGISYTNGDDRCEEYNVATGTWNILANLPRPSIMHHCILLPDGNILVWMPRGYYTVFDPINNSFGAVARDVLLDAPVRYVTLALTL